MKVRNLEKTFKNQASFLKRYRKSNLLSQSAVAEITGYKHGQALSNSERGLQTLPFFAWVKLHDKYAFDWNELKEAMLKDHESWIMDHYLLTNEGMKHENISSL